MTSMSIIKKPEWHLWRKWPNACPVQFCGWRWSQALEFQYTVRLHLVILRTGREPYQHVYFSLLQCKSRKKQAQCAYELQDAAHSSSQQGIDTPGQVLSIDLKRFKSWNWLKCRTLFFFFQSFSSGEISQNRELGGRCITVHIIEIAGEWKEGKAQLFWGKVIQVSLKNSKHRGINSCAFPET